MLSPLKRVQRDWDAWGYKDPLFAVMSRDDKRGGKWNSEEFFRTGRIEIDDLMSRIAGLPIRPARHEALDFGCGVGRLTQALSEHYEAAVGVDIAPSMIELAKHYNIHGDRCRYVLNLSPDLRLFDANRFDLVYSNIVLQHMPPSLGRAYLPEFVRILAPGGIAVFHCPSERVRTDIPFNRRVGAIGREIVRMFANLSAALLKRRPPFPKMLMSAIPRDDVLRIVEGAGGSVLRSDLTPWGSPGWIAYTYYVSGHP